MVRKKTNPHLRRSQDQETRIARKAGGTKNSGSGNKWLRKNDVRTENESWELKTTTAKSYPLKLSELETAEKNALIDGRMMVFGIDIAGRNYVVLTEEDYFSLRESWSSD